MLILIDLLLGDDDEDESKRSARGISDYWEKVKNYFRDLQIDLKEKYAKFGEWVKDVLDKGYGALQGQDGEHQGHCKGVLKTRQRHQQGNSHRSWRIFQELQRRIGKRLG
ncbi:hypothetical protein TNIN_291741 [Trichonephila inaurata madagascariensis]|uniref:Uncharacterized protein n=1 Tax=Trichonephila inaurata madagascariensis TaxID=2747483 RepID=A0A8X6Y2V2_9ARAC|nr:hypothetical protein TNIN_291741 [Trichonephila inaurata madagascariensis]